MMWMSKKQNELKTVAALADNYRKLPDERLLAIRQGYSPNWGINYRKALNVVLKERGLNISN